MLALGDLWDFNQDDSELSQDSDEDSQPGWKKQPFYIGGFRAVSRQWLIQNEIYSKPWWWHTSISDTVCLTWFQAFQHRE